MHKWAGELESWRFIDHLETDMLGNRVEMEVMMPSDSIVKDHMNYPQDSGKRSKSQTIHSPTQFA